jgi:hypothetical protein
MDIYCSDCNAWVKQNWFILKEKGAGRPPRLCLKCYGKLSKVLRENYRISKRSAIGASEHVPRLFGGMSQ